MRPQKAISYQYQYQYQFQFREMNTLVVAAESGSMSEKSQHRAARSPAPRAQRRTEGLESSSAVICFLFGLRTFTNL
jgi:hypothetical protein